MTRSLYLKANGEMPCWDDVGESTILRKLDPEAVAAEREHDLARFDRLIEIRSAFAEGRTPFPGVCERCAVREHGPLVTELVPNSLDVLHVEPSYLCRLSCPLCIPSKLRISLKGAPYQLSPEMYRGFLRVLRSEDVQTIALVHFEGRGDPVSNPRLGELVQLTKEYYPTADTLITTHGNIPYRAWILDSGLDAIRFSVDGAFPENYAKYRVGGKLETVVKLMRDIRDEKVRTGKRLVVQWKYILFEWNDSDDELREAARLARELEVTLRFCRTHSEGRSQRFPDTASVERMIAELAPGGSADMTFQLKTTDDVAGVDVVRGEHVRGLLAFALQRRAAGDEAGALDCISNALALDVGANGVDVPAFRDDADLFDRLPALIGHVTLATTLSNVAAYLAAYGGTDVVPAVLTRYLELAPNAPDRKRVEADIGLREAFAAERDGRTDLANDRIERVLADAPVPRDPAAAHLGAALGSDDPGIVVALANILALRGRLAQAELLFERYLDLAPGARDSANVVDMLDRLGAEKWLRLAIARERMGSRDDAERWLRRALMHDPGGAAAPPDAALDAIVPAVRNNSTVTGIAELSAIRGDTPTVVACEARLAERRPR